MVRNLATLGGESVFGAPDSEVAAALLALNAVFVVDCPDGPDREPGGALPAEPGRGRGGRPLTSLFIPGAPEGAALERVAVLPSAPALVAVAVAVSFSGDKCARARIASPASPARRRACRRRRRASKARTADADGPERAADQVARGPPSATTRTRPRTTGARSPAC